MYTWTASVQYKSQSQVELMGLRPTNHRMTMTPGTSEVMICNSMLLSLSSLSSLHRLSGLEFVPGLSLSVSVSKSTLNSFTDHINSVE